jgi:TonB-linked SusC/RagA family outer membrane protein
MKHRRHTYWGIVLLSLLTLTQAWAQSRTVTGTVRSGTDNATLPGVNVAIKGRAVGTTTDAQGRYRLAVPDGPATLAFSSVGFTRQEVPVGSQSEINVTLAEDAAVLSEVVVTASAIEREKKTLGYAVTNLRNEEFTKASEQNLLRSLQGRVAGVQISGATGGAGGATRVVIRGAQSFNGNNQPIFVVDGVIISNNNTTTAGTGTALNIGNDLNNGVDITNRAGDIDPNNVESVSILKGPAASALYGSQAASGAIIITTKNRSRNAPRSQITINTAWTFETPLRLPKFQNTFGGGFNGEYEVQNNVSWGPKMDGRLVPNWRTEGLVASGVQAEQDSIPFVPYPGNVRDFFQTGVTRNLSLGISGNTGTSNYALTVSNVGQTSMIPNTAYRRTSLNLGAGTRLFNDRVSTSFSLTYTNSGGDRGVQGQGRANILQTILNTPRHVSLVDQRDYTDPRYDLDNYYLAGFRNNPYWLLDNNLLTDNVNRIFGNAQVGYDPTKWLNVTYRIGTDVFTDYRKQTFAKGTINNVDGRYVEDNTLFTSLISDLIVTLNRDLTPDLNARLILGHNLQERNTSRAVADAQPLIVPDFYDLSNGTTVVNNRIDLRSRIFGVYGDLQLSFKDYLFLSLTGRNDWASTLPKKNQSFFYPGTSLSFVFSDALDWKGKILSYGKLRGNIASVGKIADPYVLNPVFVRSDITDGFQGQYVFPLNGVPGFRVGNVRGNPDLRSELTTSWELGTELQFFNNRLGLDFTYYNSVSKNQIVNVPISSTSGFNSQVLNAGTMENKGIEVLLTGSPVRTTSGLRWDLSVNFTRNRNRVTELYNPLAPVNIGGLGSVGLQARLGEPYGTFFGSRMLRDPEGRVVVSPTTGRPLPDPTQVALGNIQPDFTAGLSNTISFKGLALNVLFDTRQGGKFYSQTTNTGRFTGILDETTEYDREQFIYPNSVLRNPDGTFSPNTTVKTGGFEYWSTVSNIGENTLFDASFVKLREVSLSYTLPKTLISRVKLAGVQLSLIGRNLALWTPASQPHVDPEVSSFGTGNSQGYEFLAYPSARSYGFSVKVTL